MEHLIEGGTIVEILGDGMAADLWERTRDALVVPFLNINVIQFDLSLINRDATEDEVVKECVTEIKKHNVGIKCATKAADEIHKIKYNLKRESISPNVIIRNSIGGTIFREPIEISIIPPTICWEDPIIVSHLAELDLYEATELKILEPGILEFIFIPENGADSIKLRVNDFKEPGVAMFVYITDQTAKNFAHASFNYALKKELDLYLTLASKSDVYRNFFINIFQRIFDENFRQSFQEKNIEYKYMNLKQVMIIFFGCEGNGGFIWCQRMYEGDAYSSFLGSIYGMMSSVFVGHDGKTVFSEICHGVPKEINNCKVPGFNPTEQIIAWANAIRHRAKLDNNEELYRFSEILESAPIELMESGTITKDLSDHIEDSSDYSIVNSYEFIAAVAEMLIKKLEEDCICHKDIDCVD